MKWTILFVLAGVVIFACGANDLYQVTAGPADLQVEVVDTEETRARGLMFRESLPETQGMLFVFEDVARRAFYMKNTSIPLSIAFIDERMIIREIYDMEPFSLETVPSLTRARYALEMNQGAFARLGIAIGDRLTPSNRLNRRLAN